MNLSLTSTLKYNEANTIKLKRVSGKFGIYNESDVLISNELFDEFAQNDSNIETIKIDDYLAGGWYEYDQNVTDHRPVALKLLIDSNLGIKDIPKNDITHFINYPNPFNPITRITYSISNNEYIDIYITDLNGSNIKYLFKGNILSGSHSIIWDGTDDSSNDMPSGVYFLTLKSSTFNQTIKMMYLK